MNPNVPNIETTIDENHFMNMVHAFFAACIEGEADPMRLVELEKTVGKMQKYIKGLKAADGTTLSDLAELEVEKHPGGLIRNGVKYTTVITERASGEKSFGHIPAWKERFDILKEIEKKSKELRKKGKPAGAIVDDETGEAIEVFPPQNVSASKAIKAERAK